MTTFKLMIVGSNRNECKLNEDLKKFHTFSIFFELWEIELKKSNYYLLLVNLSQKCSFYVDEDKFSLGRNFKSKLARLSLILPSLLFYFITRDP